MSVGPATRKTRPPLPRVSIYRGRELAASLARRFNNAKTRGYALEELQLDELNTFLGNRNQKTWVFAGIEVWSRLWTSSLVGSRSNSNTKRFIRSIADTSNWSPFPFITSDGMKFYARSIQLTFGVACVHAQVIKKIKKNRVVARWPLAVPT